MPHDFGFMMVNATVDIMMNERSGSCLDTLDCCFMARGKVGTTMSKMAGLCHKLGACLVKNMVHTHSIPNYEKVIYQCIHYRINFF